jgi:hypothetical protein
VAVHDRDKYLNLLACGGVAVGFAMGGQSPRIADRNIRSLISFPGVVPAPKRLRSDGKGAQRAADITLRVQAGPFAPRAVLKPRQRRDQFGFGAKPMFVVPIEHRSNIDQQRAVLILALPIRTKGHSVQDRRRL